MNPNFKGTKVYLSPKAFENILEEINESQWAYVHFLTEIDEGRCVYWQGVHFKERLNEEQE